MRLPSFPNILRTLYTFSNATTHSAAAFRQRTLGAGSSFYRSAALRSMPTIPFLGSLFSSSASSRKEMSYPVKKTDDEWQAVLNPGELILTYPLPSFMLIPT